MRLTIARRNGLPNFFRHHVATLLCLLLSAPATELPLSFYVTGLRVIESRPAIILGFNTQLSVTWHARRPRERGTE